MLKDFLYYLLRKEADEMAVIYATLIVKGKKTYAQVPDKMHAALPMRACTDCP